MPTHRPPSYRPPTRQEKFTIVYPRMAGLRGLAIAQRVFTPEGLASVGAHPDEDPRLLFEVWCLNRGKAPIDPTTLAILPRTVHHVTEMMTYSPAFTALLENPEMASYYAPPEAKDLDLWRAVSRLARTYWFQYALDRSRAHDLAMWGYTADDDPEAAAYECDLIANYLLESFPKPSFELHPPRPDRRWKPTTVQAPTLPPATDDGADDDNYNPDADAALDELEDPAVARARLVPNRRTGWPTWTAADHGYTEGED